MQIQWQKLVSREGVDITTISGIDYVFYIDLWRYTNTHKELFFTYVKNKKFTHYIGVESRGAGLWLYKKIGSKDKIKKLYIKGNALLKKTKASALKWNKALAKNSTNKLLLKAFQALKAQFVYICHHYSACPWLAIEEWQKEVAKTFKELIEKHNLIKQEEILSASLYKPWNKTALALNKIPYELKAGASSVVLAKKYQFLRSWALVWYGSIDKAWIENLRPQGKGYVKFNVRTYTLSKVFKLLKPSRRQKKILEMASYVIFFKDWRDDLRRRHIYYWSFLFDYIAKHFEVLRDDIGYLTLDEIEECLRQNRFMFDAVSSRKSNPCIVTMDLKTRRIKVIEHVPLRYQKIMADIAAEAKQSELTGIIAQTGYARGKVVIVESFHDIKKVETGAVLVANTTHPNYLLAMKKACAFVTNEGGAISHAAIVARELKKPCIVGTKTATHILRSGDLVEVDARLGVVRMIERS